MTVLIIAAYVIAAILAFVLVLLLFVLLVPIRYRFEGRFTGKYEMTYRVRCSPLLIFGGSAGSFPESVNQNRVTVCGLTFPINLADPGKKKEKKKKDKKKDKDRAKKKDLPFTAYVRATDRDLLSSLKILVFDLLKILKPDRFELSGEIGLEEPHLTGYLAALKYSLEALSDRIRLNFEPHWDGEHYNLHLFTGGTLVLGRIVCRAVSFLLTRRTRQFLMALKKEKAAYAA